MEITADIIIQRYKRAKLRRNNWEEHWRECYDYSLPQRDGALGQGTTPGAKRTEKLFDGTAPDAVEQLAASLAAELTPPWGKWFELIAGNDISKEDCAEISQPLARISETLQSHFNRSSFLVEMHQCYLDLVSVGTASLLFEQGNLGESSAFKFTAIPIGQTVLEEGPGGKLDVTYRHSEWTYPQLASRFPDADIASPKEVSDAQKFAVIEAVWPDKMQGYHYAAILENDSNDIANGKIFLAKGKYSHSPFINFRWMKAPGEFYGRSPVMKALPDIKTANKVVELILKNATIAVTGIWQADDDGVLNPATVKLVPGTIIPKAMGSGGLTPLKTPGQFDVSQIILSDLRARIRHALLADKLGQIGSTAMTATEVLERSAEMARILGATYGRLQSELLMPLAERALSILQRRGDIPDIYIDGREIDLQVLSPIARTRQRDEAQMTLQWLETIRLLGPEASKLVKADAIARWLAKSFNVPEALLYSEEELKTATSLDSPELDRLLNAFKTAAENSDISEQPVLSDPSGGKKLAHPAS